MLRALTREPFRAFFPLGVALGAVGMAPWILFGRGLMHTWPGPYHSITMTQGFLVALAVGFLGTMLPRRLQGQPLSGMELALMGLLCASVPVTISLRSLLWTEVSFASVLAILGQYVVRRLAKRPPVPAPPAFLLIPVGVVGGASGAVLIVSYELGASPWTLSLGSSLAQQALMLGLVLALAPMLTAVILEGQPPAPSRLGRSARPLHAGLGLMFLASFAVEEWAWSAGGLLLRGGVCAVVILAGGVLKPGTRPGLHRKLYRWALLCIPLGLVAAGLVPGRRIPFLHISFVAGLSMLAFAVSVHVTLVHTGREAQALKNPAGVAVAGLLLVAAAVTRVLADRFTSRYFEALTVASSLWLGAALVWMLLLVPKMRRKPG